MSRPSNQAPSPLYQQGQVVIFAGANGAGKDTLANDFNTAFPDMTGRIVRHITRPPAAGEVPGEEYHFIDTHAFAELAEAQAFIEHASYPGVSSGTTYQEIKSKVRQFRFATLSANYEDGLALKDRVQILGIASTCFFVSPCPETVMRDEPETYIDLLRARMVNRGRGSDHVEGRLIMARRYRDMYLAEPSKAVYIDNGNGRRGQAGRYITQTLGA